MGSRKMEMIGGSKLEDKLMSDFNDDFKVLKVDECLKSKLYLIVISYTCLNKILIQVHSWGTLRYI